MNDFFIRNLLFQFKLLILVLLKVLFNFDYERKNNTIDETIRAN